jgi:protein phosphatase
MRSLRRDQQISVTADNLVFELAAASDRGPMRAENQDAWDILSLNAGGGCGLILADGMGGHVSGAAAARAAVDVAAEFVATSKTPTRSLKQAVADANEAVRRLRLSVGGQMSGTTLIVAIVSGHAATLASVGDSRAYLVRDGTASQLTHDHSWVAEQLRAGAITEEQAATSSQRSLLTRALMGDPVEPDVLTAELLPGDVLLLCSDGLWAPLGDEALGHIFAEGGPLRALVNHAVDVALDAGSDDNVTAVACRLRAEPRA